MDSEVLHIDGKEVVLDPNNMTFSENNLTEYLKREAGYYNNFGARLAEAETVFMLAEVEYEKVFGSRFAEIKEQGGSDKLVEGKTEADQEVIDAKHKMIKAKEDVRKLQQHLRAWDKSHENALNLGYMLRKEMEKIGGQHVMLPTYNDPDTITNLVTQ